MKVDGPKASGPLGNLRPYLRDPWKFVNECHARYGHRVKLRMLNQRAYLLSHPDDILGVLQENADAFAKGRTFQKLKLALGNGLITSEGDLWRKQNRLMRPIFGIRYIQQLVPAIESVIQAHCQWNDGSTINIHSEMNELTLKIIARTLFDLDLAAEAPTFLKDVETMMHYLIKRVRSVLSAPLWVPTSRNVEFRRARASFDELIARLIQERRASAEKKNDLLQLLIDTRDEDGTSMSDAQIRDEIITILMAGHETITNSLAWTMILLTQNEEYQGQLYKEAVAPDFYEGLSRINLHQAVLEEAMRLWPPVWAFMRQAARPLEINGLALEKGDIVFLVPFFSQRSADFWQEPLKFSPERFLPGERDKIRPGVYFPFGLGPRMCIGKVYAQVEAKLILSFLVRNYQFRKTEQREQQVEAGITLRPLNNMSLKVARR